MGQELKVVFAEEKSPKQETSNLLLKNIPPGTSNDYLELLMDSMTGLSASDGDYELLPKPGGLYVVVFNSAPGMQTLMNVYIFVISINKCKVVFAKVISIYIHFFIFSMRS